MAAPHSTPRPKTPRVCERCGERYVSNNPNRRYCRRACARAAWNTARNAGRTKWTYTCQNCGRKYAAKNRDRNQYCSRACYFEAKTRNSKGDEILIWYRNCEICGVRFGSRRRDARLCGAKACEAARDHQRYVARYRPKPKHACARCGAADVPANRKLCANCRKVSARKARRKRKALWRAKRVGVVGITVTRAQILKRWGRRCWICHKPINWKAKPPHPLSYTTDHVVPLSMGGWHDLPNLRPAHFICNALRGDNYRGQLMLCK